MTWCFLQRQAEHLPSLVSLVPHKDTLLIARSMVEGYCQLLWAAQEPEVRAKRWRAFVWVAQWRTIAGLAKAGYRDEPEKLTEATRAVLQLGDLLLTSAGQKAAAAGESLQDHMHRNWRAGTSLTQILEDIESREFVDLLYDPYSDWHHWGVWEIGQCMKWTPGHITFTGESPADSASALTMGIKSASRTMRLADEYLQLGFASEIDSFLDDLGQWLRQHADMRGM